MPPISMAARSWCEMTNQVIALTYSVLRLDNYLCLHYCHCKGAGHEVIFNLKHNLIKYGDNKLLIDFFLNFVPPFLYITLPYPTSPNNWPKSKPAAISSNFIFQKTMNRGKKRIANSSKVSSSFSVLLISFEFNLSPHDLP